MPDFRHFKSTTKKNNIDDKNYYNKIMLVVIKNDYNKVVIIIIIIIMIIEMTIIVKIMAFAKSISPISSASNHSLIRSLIDGCRARESSLINRYILHL